MIHVSSIFRNSTPFYSRIFRRIFNHKLLLGLFSAFVAVVAFESAHAAKSVKAIALFNNKAMLSINSAKARIIAVGDTLDGVELISSNTSEALVEFDGQQHKLTLNSAQILSKSLGVAPPKSYFATVEMEVNSLGFFQANGAVNGKQLEFLVDTGANLVVLNSLHAAQVDLDYRSGARTRASTAAGNANMYLVQIDKLSLGGIELENISAGVIEGRFPEIPLLGMTFLSQLNMQRDGNKMTLSRR